VALGLQMRRDGEKMIRISIDGTQHVGAGRDLLIDVINRVATNSAAAPLSQVRFLPQPGPIQTCYAYIVEVNGELVRAITGRAQAARTEAFDRILRNRERYCTVLLDSVEKSL
jgi:predicted molibdopterin-dependent oxidoreductase YjgC